ncbi:mitochondrial LETM1 and EF-hand domain-containing protein (ribosome receptor Mdm38) [Andalucia godoyi]|uniref:Mitochondrial proton/calcium exchanger protein n=1 Tax=Andalucia godoyi TaxID=505711 RepID=A0A8K0AIZ7_ANDGO|nr:mitochondrial LETM1 and EF-hand domain-containing protein (ribosome receptor Mdm38) [Andalucia godoyi]|eukprot:ANDGO_02225.mRNA.1 mitochondrial LETM1 and EF-hand domain-containing protein (ribosome receptor Mdm38)
MFRVLSASRRILPFSPPHLNASPASRSILCRPIFFSARFSSSLPHANVASSASDSSSSSKFGSASVEVEAASKPKMTTTLIGASSDSLETVSARVKQQAQQLKLDQPALSLTSPTSVLSFVTSVPSKVASFLVPLPGIVVRWTSGAVVSSFEWSMRAIRDPTILRDAWHSAKKTTKEVAHHYWNGCKLLAADMRMATKILGQLTEGRSLTRRERKALLTTAADLFRLVPFAIIVIIPFMELALPLLLKLFPNMLPSTFAEPFAAEEDRKKQLKARIELAKFLQDTVEEMALQTQISKKDPEKAKLAKELGLFVERVREASPVSNVEIAKFAKFFRDELTLDSMPRPQLFAMCRYMSVSVPGAASDSVLRFMLRNTMRQIKADDRMIYWEGVNSLSLEELKQACATRGMRSVNISKTEMRSQLSEWLELSLNQSIPSSLLILSRAFTVLTPESASIEEERAQTTEALSTTLSSLPAETVQEVISQVAGNENLLQERKRQQTLVEKEIVQAKIEDEGDSEDKKVEVVAEAVATLAKSSGVAYEKRELEELKEDIQQLPKEESAVKEKGRAMLSSRVRKLVGKLDKELAEAEKIIGDSLNIIDRDRDGVVSREEVMRVLQSLREKPTPEMLEDVMKRLDPDHDGIVLLEEVERVILAREVNEMDEHFQESLPENPGSPAIPAREEEATKQ